MRKSLRRAALVALGIVAAGVGLPAPAAHATSPIMVTDPGSSGAGTLRNAINKANATPGADTIEFALPGPGAVTITPLMDLPPITDPVTIDGYSQSGAAPATSTRAATLMVVIDGTNVGTGLVLNGDGSTVSGLVVHNVPTGDGFAVNGNNNVVKGDYVGVGRTGALAMPNGRGISVAGTGNVIGGTTPDARNVVSGNGGDGVVLRGANNQVLGNYIGTGADSTTPIANTGNGVSVSATGAVVSGNVLSGNGFDGVELGSGSDGAVVEGNWIGADGAGRVAVPNRTGMYVLSSTNQIVGNVVSGNTVDGLDIDGQAGGNTIQDNLVGVATGSTGRTALGNGRYGVNLRSANANTLGTNGAGNTISGNDDDGVHVTGPAQVISANLIGVAADPVPGRVRAIPNLGDGIDAHAPDVVIGGDLPGDGDVIGTNAANGILLEQGADRAVVHGNFIGVDSNQVPGFGNGANGIRIEASNDEIGSAAAVPPNVIATNVRQGVYVTENAAGNAIMGNSIHDNGPAAGNRGLGIDLDPVTVNPNDTGDPDAGANLGQNYPRVLSASSNATSTTANWSLNSTATTWFRVELFASPTCDPSGNGEGGTFLGAVRVRTDAMGNVAGALVAPVPTPAGYVVTMTATVEGAGRYGSTSEFSPCVTV